MKSLIQYDFARRFLLLVLALVILMGLAAPARATETEEPYRTVSTSHGDAEFTYELFLTDQNGASITNPRTMYAGDTIYVEIRLTREGYNSPNYNSYGIEFRLLTRGLTYNYDGTSLRSGTDVREMIYADGNSVGFAWYDMQQKGESINNPVLAACWSYTVEDPSMVNITVPVALIYITGDNEGHIAVGPATLYLDPNGGVIVGEDVSGTYTSGTVVILPDVQMGDWVFAGWSDGATIYPAGSAYTVSGIVTLTAQWEELERNRYLTLDPNGGEIVGEDISGYYADGEIVTLPGAEREGYTFTGWFDGVETYEAGAEYVVYNTVIIVAQWEPEATTGPITPGDGDDSGSCCIWCWLIILLLGLLILLLWKRQWVKYSLVNGDVELSYKDKEHNARVAVVLYDDDSKEYHLAQSEVVPAKQKLTYIPNVTGTPVAPIKEGKYKGKLVIVDGSYAKTKKCRIKALDKELRGKFEK